MTESTTPERRKLDQFYVTTLLTLIIVIAWLVTGLIKLVWVHDLATPILDGLVTPVIIFWFGSAAWKANGIKKKNGSTA